MEENEKKDQETQGGYQPNFRPQAGRSPRPRIQQPRQYANTGAGYKQNDSGDEGGFRPEGFGAALQGSAPQERPAYRPRTNYNNPEDGGQNPRSGYQSRGYNQQGGYGLSLIHISEPTRPY